MLYKIPEGLPSGSGTSLARISHGPRSLPEVFEGLGAASQRHS